MRALLITLARALHGRPMVLRAADKALYHLSAVTMGNLLTGLAATAAQLWEQLGYSRDDGVQAVVAMMRSVVHNIERAGIPAAVAGPYVRVTWARFGAIWRRSGPGCPRCCPCIANWRWPHCPLASKSRRSPAQSQAIGQLLRQAPAGEGGDRWGVAHLTCPIGR